MLYLLMPKIIHIALYIIYAYFFGLMLQIFLQYIPASSSASFLMIKQTEVTNLPAYLPVFYVHVYTSIFCLLAGFTQFSKYILSKYKFVHRLAGLLYVAVIILFAAPSGLYMAIHANGNVYTKISFIILSVLWFYFTLMAYVKARTKHFGSHRQMMLCSFALTCSAITLRMWKVILAYLFHPSPMDLYNVIAWLGWVPNLIFVELYLHKIIKFKFKNS